MAVIGKIDGGNAADALDIVWQIVSLSIMISSSSSLGSVANATDVLQP